VIAKLLVIGEIIAGIMLDHSVRLAALPSSGSVPSGDSSLPECAISGRI